MKSQAISTSTMGLYAFSSHNAHNVNYSQRDLPRLFAVLKVASNTRLEVVFSSSSPLEVEQVCSLLNKNLPAPLFFVHRYDPFYYSRGVK